MATMATRIDATAATAATAATVVTNSKVFTHLTVFAKLKNFVFFTIYFNMAQLINGSSPEPEAEASNIGPCPSEKYCKCKNFKNVESCDPNCPSFLETKKAADEQKKIIPIQLENLPRFEIHANAYSTEPISTFYYRFPSDEFVASRSIPSYLATRLERAANEKGCKLGVHSTRCISITESPFGEYFHLLKYVLEEGKEYEASIKSSSGMLPVILKMTDGELYIA